MTPRHGPAAAAAFLALFFLPLPAAAQDFGPIVAASIHDEPPDGMGDSFNLAPFTGLIRKQATREDRAIHEFDLSSLAGAPITSATLSGRVHVNNSFDNGLRTFDFLLYHGNGVADLSDYQIPALFVGSDSYHPPFDSEILYSFDCTAQVQQLLLSGASFVGLRVQCSSLPNFPNILEESSSVLTIVAGGSGVAYCFGDGSGAACPCGNPGAAGRGCANSTGPTGAALQAGGSASVTAGDLVLAGSGLAPSQPGLYYQGDGAVNGGQGAVFGDGLRCAGTGVVRLQTVTADGAGNSATSIDVALKGGAMAGDQKFYQLWYRDPVGGPCGSGFNLTNGLAVTWTP